MVTVWVALLECLRARRRYSIHAAGLIDPGGDLVLLIGRSGVAKTTAAVSLLQAGWSALGDDRRFWSPTAAVACRRSPTAVISSWTNTCCPASDCAATSAGDSRTSLRTSRC